MNRRILDKRRKKLGCLVDDDDVVVQLDDLPENCIFNILVRLPLESLCTLRFVCKLWYGIFTSTDFRNSHLLHLWDDPGTRGIIFYTRVQNYSPPPEKVFSVESNATVTDVHSSFHIESMEVKDGKGTIKDLNTAFRVRLRIVATCDGLIVLEKNLCARRLILLNPVTRELEDVPVGTTSSEPGCDLYGLAALSRHASSRRYKLLHLFMKDKVRNLLGCEIMDIGSGSWRTVDVPPVERFDFLNSPVFAMGALRWIQCVDIDHGECMVSMPLDDDGEKFKTKMIPTTGGGFNTVFAMGEFLGLSSRAAGEDNQIEVWILRGDECDWEKQYDIDARGWGYMTPLLHIDKLVLTCAGDKKCFYTYDRHSGDLTKIVMVNNWAAAGNENWTLFPHVNSLVSWRRRS